MRIQELHLQNFRGFQELKLKLPPNLAVFIGDNGSGKSSVLDIIAIFLSEFIFDLLLIKSLILENSEFNLFKLTDDDININSDITHNKITISTDSNTELVWENIKYGKSDMLKASHYNVIHHNAQVIIKDYSFEVMEKLNNQPDISLPILVYYQTNRMLVNFPYTKNLNEDKRKSFYNDQIDAYKTAFSNQINSFQEFFEWFKEEEEYENEVRLRENNNFRNSNLETVRKALETFLEGFPDTEFSDLHIIRASSNREGGVRHLSKPSLVIKKNGENFKLDQLSDGEKTLLMIVVDIARRLAILNPSITDPSELLETGTGIILIDEIDLHLHPQWQRIVIPSFRRTFPNCQFIVTTHSPQVLSGVNKENVFILEDSKIVEITPHTFGRDSNSILSEVMGVEKRPVKMQERLDRCFDMIDNNNLDGAKLELKKLSELLGNNDPELVRGYTLIDFLSRVE